MIFPGGAALPGRPTLPARSFDRCLAPALIQIRRAMAPAWAMAPLEGNPDRRAGTTDSRIRAANRTLVTTRGWQKGKMTRAREWSQLVCVGKAEGRI